MGQEVADHAQANAYVESIKMENARVFMRKLFVRIPRGRTKRLKTPIASQTEI